MNGEGPSRWPPKFMAGDSHEVALYKRWINKENALAHAAQKREIPYEDRPSLQATMSHKYLAPDPTYAAGSSHLRALAPRSHGSKPSDGGYACRSCGR